MGKHTGPNKGRQGTHVPWLWASIGILLADQLDLLNLSVLQGPRF